MLLDESNKFSNSLLKEESSQTLSKKNEKYLLVNFKKIDKCLRDEVRYRTFQEHFLSTVI